MASVKFQCKAQVYLALEPKHIKTAAGETQPRPIALTAVDKTQVKRRRNAGERQVKRRQNAGETQTKRR